MNVFELIGAAVYWQFGVAGNMFLTGLTVILFLWSYTILQGMKRVERLLEHDRHTYDPYEGRKLQKSVKVQAIALVILFIPCAIVTASVLFAYSPEYKEVSYVSEEHKLVAASNSSSLSGETNTSAGLLFYASNTTIEDRSVLQYIRLDSDSNDSSRSYKTVVSWPLDQIRIYEDNSREPVEKHHHVKEVLVNPFNSDEYRDKPYSDRLDYIEIVIPENSVVHGYNISVNQGDTSSEWK